MSKLTEALKGTNSRAVAAQAIAAINPSKAELADAARALDIRADGNKTQIAQRLINGTAGSREDSAAIRGANLR
jgi:hypothetical protein